MGKSFQACTIDQMPLLYGLATRGAVFTSQHDIWLLFSSTNDNDTPNLEENSARMNNNRNKQTNKKSIMTFCVGRSPLQCVWVYMYTAHCLHASMGKARVIEWLKMLRNAYNAPTTITFVLHNKKSMVYDCMHCSLFCINYAVRTKNRMKLNDCL